MSINISKENGIAIVDDLGTGDIIVSSERSVIKIFGSSSVVIYFPNNNSSISFQVSDINLINGSAPPTNVIDLMKLLGQIFSGPTINVSIS